MGTREGRLSIGTGDGGTRRRLIGLILGGGAAAAMAAGWLPGAVASAAAAGRREKRPTLDPARFVGKARTSHEVARESPDLLDQLYCYCHCDKSIGHRSLLSCYTDGHAAT